MGGYGSGPQHKGKRTVDDGYVLDATLLARRGAFARLPRGPAPVHISGRMPLCTRAVFVPEESGSDGTLVLSHTPQQWGGSRIPVHQRIAVSTTPLTYGGARRWFHCPLSTLGVPCFRRCRMLYLPHGEVEFGCRQCYDLAYRSQRRSPTDRLVRRLAKIERELAWDEGVQRRPKGMRRRTYRRLCDDYDQAEAASLSSFNRWVERRIGSRHRVGGEVSTEGTDGC